MGQYYGLDVRDFSWNIQLSYCHEKRIILNVQDYPRTGAYRTDPKGKLTGITDIL